MPLSITPLAEKRQNVMLLGSLPCDVHRLTGRRRWLVGFRRSQTARRV